MLRETEPKDREQLYGQWRNLRISPSVSLSGMPPSGVTLPYDATPPTGRPASNFLGGAGVAAVFAFLVGTGGLLTASYITQRDARGYRFNAVDYKSRDRQAASAASARTPLQDLSHIRTTFDVSIARLARFLGVSRQTIYNWEAGDPIADHNQQVIQQMAIAADVLEAAGLPSNREIERPLSSGKSLLALLRDGASGASAAHSLLALLAAETAQRERLTARLRDRMKRPVNLDEAGIPSFDERI
jgi:DNA-binding transcriptional regulator YiaG